MSNNLKVLLAVLAGIVLMTQKKICSHLGFGQAKIPPHSIAMHESSAFNETFDPQAENDDSFQWEDRAFRYGSDNQTQQPQKILASNRFSEAALEEPIQLEWKTLINIDYKLRYFRKLDMEIYAPIFTDELKKLDGKEVLIKGFVIHFDPKGELLALSANPYASCFFCGKASPASVISLYPKDEKNRYKMDDLRTFRGTLHLNPDNPDEFYYILRDAVSE